VTPPRRAAGEEPGRGWYSSAAEAVAQLGSRLFVRADQLLRAGLTAAKQGQLSGIMFWAALIGICGAITGVGFRAAVRLVPSLRQAAQRQAANQLNANQFSLATLQSSLETSLRQLRTDYLDMLLMHGPPVSILQQDDLLEALGRLVEQGKVRMAGLSADIPVIEKTFAERPPVLTAAQFPVNLSNIAFTTQTAQQKEMFLVANHPFGGPTGVAASRERIAKLAKSPELSAELREKLANDDPQLLLELIFNVILDGTGISAVIPAMMQPAHIRANVQAIENCRFTSEELAEIRTALAS